MRLFTSRTLPLPRAPLAQPVRRALVAAPILVKADDNIGAGANVLLTTGNCLPGASFSALPVPVPGRAYCSIPVTKSLNFPTGIYYAEGGDATCVGFCIQTGNTDTTS